MFFLWSAVDENQYARNFNAFRYRHSKSPLRFFEKWQSPFCDQPLTQISTLIMSIDFTKGTQSHLYEKSVGIKKGKKGNSIPFFPLGENHYHYPKPLSWDDLSSWQDKSSSQKGWVSIDRSVVAALPSTTPRPVHKSSTDDLGPPLCQVNAQERSTHF